jgi:hypothetical protein
MGPPAPAGAATHNETLFELAQWLARVQQYSASHPACAQLGERTHAALMRSLAIQSPLVIDVLTDGMSIDGTPVTHAAVRTRLAPYMHERGVLVIKFLQGTTVEELTSFIELLTLPVQTTFDRGGVCALAKERGLSRIQLEEIAHEFSIDEREAQRRRERLRTRFAEVLRDLIARRSLRGLTGTELLELLEHPDLAVMILEEDPLGIADALAGLCWMVREEEKASGKELYPKLKAIILLLSPLSHDRVLIGLPMLVGDFRESLVWALDGLDEGELARVALASFRAHAAELSVTLYALAVAVPHDGRRVSTLRRVALLFYDLPLDDSSSTELITACAMNMGDVDSYYRERECLSTNAMNVLLRRGALSKTIAHSEPPAARGQSAPPRDYIGDARRVMRELVKMSSRTRRFPQLCAKLPETAVTLARAGASESVLGILDGLQASSRPEVKELAIATLRSVVSPAVASNLLADTDSTSAHLEGAQLDDVIGTVRLLTALAPTVVFEQLELSESRKMRRIFLDALSAVGPRLLPLVRQKLHVSSWFIVRNALVILPKCGGTPADLWTVAAHSNEKVRLEVLRALRLMPSDTKAMDLIAAYLSDAVPEIRQHSIILLRGELLSVEAVARLERIASAEEQPEDVRLRVVEALGRCPLDAAATALNTLMQPRGLIEVSSLRDHIAVALRKSTAPLAAGYFAEGLKSPAYRVRKACERAAGAAT